MSNKAPLFWNLISGMLFTLLLCFATIYRNQKSKEDFFHITSKITSLFNSLQIQGDLNLDNEPIRYLKIKNYPKYFKLSIGEDLDGSKPYFQQIDSLKVGDIITVYYDENGLSDDTDVSRLAYFLDKNNKPYFIQGRKNIIGYCLIGICLTVIVVAYSLKKAGKIS
jgi:hypothetical protein